MTLHDTTLDAASVWGRVEAVVAAVDPAPRGVLVRLHDRLVIEALANLGPIRPEAPEPLLPPRRRFLDDQLLERRRRCATARRVATTIDRVTPDALCVMHAILADPWVAEPGRFRSTPIAFQTGNEFGGAAAAQVPAFVAAICAELADSDLPPLESASTFVTQLLKVHPYNDGNGRLARVVFDRLMQRSVDCGISPSVDLWASSRRGYVAALIAADPDGPVIAHDSGDPTPFVQWVAEQATSGAELWVRRAATIVQAADRVKAATDGEHVAVALAVAVDRNVALSELDGVVPSSTDVVNALNAGGLLEWDRRGLLQPSRRLEAIIAA